MKVFVAGATGAIGSRLVPLLVARGHEVVAMTRSRDERALREAGAERVVADGLDRETVLRAVAHAEPEIVVHEMTALAGIENLRNFDRAFAMTNRLRTEGTDHLLEAARQAGVRRFVAQSFGNWNYEPTGGRVKTEEDPLDPDPPRSMQESLAAIRHVESAALTGDVPEGVVLRYGSLYGAGTGWTDPTLLELIRKRRLPIIGDGTGIFSFVHIEDAAVATVAAIERAAPGIYNVADDEPAPVAEWLPALAQAIGAKPPRRVPVWLGRLAAGEALASMFTRIRGASNAKARRELGWRLAYPSWREGFANGLDARPIDVMAASALLDQPPTDEERPSGRFRAA